MKVHIAISVKDIKTSIKEYSEFLQSSPALVIADEYVLWRTDELNLSLRKTNEEVGVIRHLGFEDDKLKGFDEFKDSNGVVWELFNKQAQANEINELWPDAKYRP